MMNTTFAYGYEDGLVELDNVMGLQRQCVAALVHGFLGGVVDGSMIGMVKLGERLQQDLGRRNVQRMETR